MLAAAHPLMLRACAWVMGRQLPLRRPGLVLLVLTKWSHICTVVVREKRVAASVRESERSESESERSDSEGERRCGHTCGGGIEQCMWLLQRGRALGAAGC